MKIVFNILDEMAHTLKKVVWFNAVHRPVSLACISLCEQYLEEFNIVKEIKIVKDFNKLPVFLSKSSCQSFEKHNVRLYEELNLKVSKIFPRETISFHLNRHLEELNTNIFTLAKMRSILSTADNFLAQCATGAALHAIQKGMMAILANSSSTHPFLLWLQIFFQGHWPLGVFEDNFLLI